MKSLRPAVLAGVAASAVAASFLVPTVTSAGAAPSAGDPRLDAQQAASAWVKGHASALERAAADSFVRASTFQGDNGIYAMAYERTHEGLRVVGGDFVVLADADGDRADTDVFEAVRDDRTEEYPQESTSVHSGATASDEGTATEPEKKS